MAEYDFWIKQNDTSPPISSELQDDLGNTVDVSGGSVNFHMEHKHGDESDVVSASASIISGSVGLVRYNWQSGDTATPGDFAAEWEVEYSNGKTESFPNHRDLDIRIEPEVA